MNINKVILLWMLIIFAGLNICFAEGQQKEWDYGDSKSYSNSDFLRNSDPAQWDLNKVNWNSPALYQNPKVYTRDEAYKKFNYKMVDYGNVDHSKVDGGKYLRDFGCRGCQFACVQCEMKSTGAKSLVTWGKEGKISHIKGDSVSIPGPYADKKVFFEAMDKGIVIIIDRETVGNSLEIPKSDSAVLKIRKPYFNLKYGGQDLGEVAGTIGINKNGLYIPEGENGRIYGLSITSNKKDVNLFLDGKERKDCLCNYVSMNARDKQLISNVVEDSQLIQFLGENPFIKVQTYLGIDQKFGTIIVENRDKQGLIPLITTKFQPGDGQLHNFIFNGQFNEQVTISIRNSKESTVNAEVMGKINPGAKTNPLAIMVEDIQKHSLLGTSTNPQMIVIDDKFKIATLPYGQTNPEEQGRLYFTISKDVQGIIQKAQDLAKNRKSTVDELTSQYGVPPMWVVGYLDEKRDENVVRSIVQLADKYKIDPNYLAAVAFNEGLNIYMSQLYYNDPLAKVDSYNHLGLDNIGKEIGMLKSGGYLPKDFSGYTLQEENVNEQGQKVISAEFNNIGTALEATAARLKWTEDQARKFAQERGIILDKDKTQYLTYALYNCGLACEKAYNLKLFNGQEIAQTTKVRGQNSVVANARGVLSTSKSLETVFSKKSISQIQVASVQ